ncbi:MAG: polysaccharide export protein [bacterium]|nr:polysaccharide export protein [bacterium]
MFRRIALLFVLPCTVAAGDQFILAPGDRFEVSVYGEVASELNPTPPFSRVYQVDPDGNIQVHFLGNISVEGKSLDEVRQLFNDLLSSYLVNPDVTVNLRFVVPRYVYVLGYVVGQGRLPVDIRDTVLDCIARCGGELYDARLDAVKVIRGGLSNPEIINVDLTAVIHEGDFSQNIAVQTGDIIYVPKTALYEWNEILSRIFPSLSLVERGLEVMIDYSTVYE